MKSLATVMRANHEQRSHIQNGFTPRATSPPPRQIPSSTVTRTSRNGEEAGIVDLKGAQCG